MTQDADGNFLDAEDEEEQKVQVDDSEPKIDEIAQESETNIKKRESEGLDGPEEKIHISQINDYTEFKLIDKLDKDTYITDVHVTYTP
jgi:hypothetical protein